MLVQYGYVILFSSAFPMAAMCALLNNVIEIRSDAFKLVTTMQRPFGQAVESIGTWQVWLLVQYVKLVWFQEKQSCQLPQETTCIIHMMCFLVN